MMLKPLTKFPSPCDPTIDTCENRIDKMVFKLPDEFGYPPVRDLSACDRYGVVSYANPSFDCFLTRPYRDRFITFRPDLKKDKAIRD